MQALGVSRALQAAARNHSKLSSNGGSLIARAFFTIFPRDGPFHASRRYNLYPLSGRLYPAPWSTTQLRHARFSGADVKPGNVIERKGRYYQVVKAQHTTQGRGGAIIQVELRDVESGNKLNERLRTDEALEKVFVQEKTFHYLYSEDDTVVLVDPKTYTQVTVPKHLFGESLGYLTDDMKVAVQFCDDRPMSASVPPKVTCTVAEAQVIPKGSTITPQYKKVKLDNGLTVQVPAHVSAGEQIVISTIDHSYISSSDSHQQGGMTSRA